ncbi:hypothetical protein ACP70R_037858 [Stipagrostis hirtigluma subsp. patula]
MATADPLHLHSSAARLLPRALGSVPVPAASPSKAHEALLPAISGPLKGSAELVEQARLAMDENGDIQTLYQDHGAKDMDAENGRANQRRPGMNRKRSHFVLKPAASKHVPKADFDELKNISDPVKYFATLAKLQEAMEEVNRLTGVVPIENVDDPKPKRRPGMQRRVSTHTYSFSAGTDIENVIDKPASETGIITESQFTQEAGHASVPEEIEQSIPSGSKKRAISDVSAREDLFDEKENANDLPHDVLATLRNLSDKSEEEAYLLKTLGLKERNTSRGSLLGSAVSAVRLLRSNTLRRSPRRVLAPERPVPGSLHARISEVEKLLFSSDVPKDKCADLSEDDESEGSPDTEMCEQHQSPSVKSADNVLDTEPSIPDDVTVAETQAGGSPLSLYRDTEVAKENDVSSRPTISMEFAMEEDEVPVDHPTLDKSNNKREISSSRHLDSSSTEVLFSTPGRKDTARTLHAAEENIQHQEVVEGEDGVLQDRSSHPLEIPLEDIDPQNQSQMHDERIKKLADGLRDAVSPTKEKKQKAAPKRRRKQNAAPKGKKKQQSKRDREVPEEPTHPLEISQENFDSENQPQNHVLNTEQQAVDSNNSLPDETKGPKKASRGNKTRGSDRRESLAGLVHAKTCSAGLTWQSGVRKSTRIRTRPLQDWLGERFVYGRVHDSLLTVIGVKTLSPDQSGKEVLKVKSFVPEEYADLLTNSAKY